MDYILGVDGGGTKTLALLGDLNGNVLARGVSRSSNYNAVGFDAACSALESAIRMAQKDYPGEISALCLGLAGAGRKEDIELFEKWAANKFPKNSFAPEVGVICSATKVADMPSASRRCGK
jgi:N-acetylglucosamine kinase-like BadF-type ATPase